MFNWKNSKAEKNSICLLPSDRVLRLRGGAPSPPSRSPSPPPTRPNSPTSGCAASLRPVRPVRPAASDRSRSGHGRCPSLSPDRRHSAPSRGQSRGRTPAKGKLRVQTHARSVTKTEPESFFCSNNCNAQFSTDRARRSHEAFHCRSSDQVT